MNKTKIDWPGLDYTFNPVVGCKHNCSYCYARELNNRFKFIEKWNKPQFFPERLSEPANIKKPSKIFVGSMCDLFGEWVPSEWLIPIQKVCRDNPHHTFMFLTKNPERYYWFLFPQNCQLGTTITTKKDYERVLALKRSQEGLIGNKLFLSIEPILGDFSGVDFSGIDQIIVGAMTGKKAVIPEQEWIESIKHDNIHYKRNIQKYVENCGKA